MKKILGIFSILVVVVVVTAIKSPNFLGAGNLQNTIRWSSLYSIIAIGVAFVIITGGIDLSIGSVIGLVGCLLPLLLTQYQWRVVPAILMVLAISVLIGLAHGLLITKVRLQPFVVTLCGLLIYRGLTRYFTHDVVQGYGNGYQGLKAVVNGKLINSFTGRTPTFDFPNIFLYMLVIAVIAAFFLNRTIWGRYLFALGRNEEAARFSGIRTHRIIIMTYVICSTLAGIAGVLFSVDGNSVSPSTAGNFYELYAIAGAVLGGCSLRGGEGSILGVIIGSTLIRVLYNAINMLDIPTQLEFAIIGMVILLGVTADELVRRFAARRRQAQQQRGLASAAPVSVTPKTT